LTQVAGTSARAEGTIETAAAAAINMVKGKVCRKIGFIVSSILVACSPEGQQPCPYPRGAMNVAHAPRLTSTSVS
jgi:hypothetical protein